MRKYHDMPYYYGLFRYLWPGRVFPYITIMCRESINIALRTTYSSMPAWRDVTLTILCAIMPPQTCLIYWFTIVKFCLRVCAWNIISKCRDGKAKIQISFPGFLAGKSELRIMALQSREWPVLGEVQMVQETSRLVCFVHSIVLVFFFTYHWLLLKFFLFLLWCWLKLDDYLWHTLWHWIMHSVYIVSGL